jgi:CubicO group peptidase (beta-lactamase class C family)
MVRTGLKARPVRIRCSGMLAKQFSEKFAIAECNRHHAGSVRSPIFFAAALVLVRSTIAFAEIQPSDCARAAKYSETRRGSAVLVLQNGRTIFEHYANGGSANRPWPIFSGTKSFWGIAALAAVREGLFKLDDPVSNTINEWKSDPGKSQITIRQLLSQRTALKVPPIFNGLPFAIATLSQSPCPVWLNLVRRLFTGQVTSRSFPNCCAGNWAGAA